MTIDYPHNAKVVRADQSPLNKKQWCLELDCGHEVWVTSRGKPTRETAYCYHIDHRGGFPHTAHSQPNPEQAVSDG